MAAGVTSGDARNARDELTVGIDYRPALLGSSGIGRAVRELVRALCALPGVEPRLFGHSLARARRRDPIPAGARLYRWPLPGRALPLLQRIGVGADRLSGRPRLFHWTDYVQPPVSDRTRTVLTLHDVAFAEDVAFHGAEQSRTLLDRTRWAASRSALVLCPTRATAAAAERHLGLDPERLRVIPFGADHVPRQPGPHPLGGRPFVLSLGTIEPRKNHLRLLRAWQLLDEPRPVLVVLGRPGWESAEAEGALTEAARGGAGDVVWLRRADDATVMAHLAHAELLAYPSLLEGFGFPPLEALALGTPVVAGDTPALREVLGPAARFCDPRSEEDIAEAIAAALQDRDLRRHLEAAGRHRAASFTWRRAAELHVEAYREAIA